MANVPATVGKKDNVLTRTLKSLNRTKYIYRCCFCRV